MLTLTQAVSRVASRLNKNPNDTTVYNRIKNHINDVCLEKWHGYAWSFRFREYPLVLTPRVASGTLTATNASRSITASGTPFDSSLHVGAWLRFTADSPNAWYRILSVDSTSTATIDPAYQGTTGASKAYELNKVDYRLPTEISDIGQITVTYNQHAIPVQHQLVSDQYDFPMASAGGPCKASVFNQEQKVTTYATGTVSGTLNTVTLTGAGTSWLSNVNPGDEFYTAGDSNVYTVYRVDSDTQITLYQKLTATISALTAYTIQRQFGHILRITPASDTAYVCFVKGLRAYAPLINTSDTNELLARYPHAVIEGAIWREAGASPDPREDGLYQRSEIMWAKAQGEDEQLVPTHNSRPIWNPRG